MKLNDGMLLFHGSYTAVEKIDLGYCAGAKDFGRGFYLTSDVNQAKNFVRSVVDRARTKATIPLDQNYGYISSYRFRMPEDGLRIHEFESASRDWLWFIANNRRGGLVSESMKWIQSIGESDVIVGKVANDQTNPVITIYLNGIFGDIDSERAVNEAIRQLIPDHLVDQYCFVTEKAIRCLEFQEARKYVVK